MKILAVIGLLLAAQSTFASDLGRVCVLMFEKKNHPFSKSVLKSFEGKENVDVFIDAVPLDFYECMIGDYSEVMLVAHSVYTDESMKVAKLGYFKELKGEDRAGMIGASIEALKLEVEDAEKAYRKARRRAAGVCRRPPCVWRSRANRYKAKWRKVESTLTRVQNLRDDFPVYGQPKLFLKQVFRKTRNTLRTQVEEGKEVQVKHLRFLSCNPKEVFRAYPEFKELVQENKIKTEVAPPQLIMSLLKGRRVSTLDERWIEESGQSGETEKYFYAYMPLTTVGLYRWGKGTALQGKYKIKYHGVAAGLGSKWSTVYLKHKDVKDLEVGESKTITTPMLDFSVALWANFEVGLGEKSYVQLPTEINSIGASLGFLSIVEVERVY